MKKFNYLAILLFLMAVPVFFSSCGDDDDLIPEEKQEQVMKEWVEPFHVRNATIEEVKAYMDSSMTDYQLSAETSGSDHIQLAYSASNGNVGILYSFSALSGQLYSVIDTELCINSSVIIDYLSEHYTLVSSDKTTLQYCFTTPDKSLVVTTVKISDSCFNINYSFVY